MFGLFPQSPLHLKHTFSAFGETLYAGRVKPLAEASELITHALCLGLSSSAKRRLRCASFRGPKGWQPEGAKWRLGRTFHPAVWRYRAGSGLDSSSCLVETFEFVVIDFCNVRTCHSAVTVAPLFKNYTNKTPALSHKTLAITLPAQVRTFEFGTQFVFRTGAYKLHSSVFAS